MVYAIFITRVGLSDGNAVTEYATYECEPNASILGVRLQRMSGTAVARRTRGEHWKSVHVSRSISLFFYVAGSYFPTNALLPHVMAPGMVNKHTKCPH
uniref:Uncharacterized protein n=1 Tax=Hyaloperonospora arabidopsidis (strain Emoy2) TaxID=559515 RepID=M4BQP8_HYAAE